MFRISRKITFYFFSILIFQSPSVLLADYPATVTGWYDYGYSGKVSMMPTGNGRIMDWHARYPGHPDMYTIPEECSFDGQQLYISCYGCSGYFTCHADYYCPGGQTPLNDICPGEVLPPALNFGPPGNSCN